MEKQKYYMDKVQDVLPTLKELHSEGVTWGDELSILDSDLQVFLEDMVEKEHPMWIIVEDNEATWEFDEEFTPFEVTMLIKSSRGFQ